jgi:hypothetical protein
MPSTTKETKGGHNTYLYEPQFMTDGSATSLMRRETKGAAGALRPGSGDDVAALLILI